MIQYFLDNKIRHEDFSKFFELITIKIFKLNLQPHFTKVGLKNIVKVLV